MSISTVATKITYVGNDSTVTPYPITFKYLEDSHVNVYVDGVLQVLGAAQDYVLAGDGAAGTGSFTTKVAQDATKSVVVVLDVPFDQPVVLQETSSLPAKVMEVEGFDRLNMQIRRVWRRLQDAITFSNDEGGTGSTGTADNLLGFDGSGDITEIPNSTFVQTADGIDGHGDVTITNPISGEVLSWNGSAWVNDVSGNGDALVANGLDQFAATTSLELKDTISDETGSGALVFATSPTLVTPDLGTPSAADLTNATNYPYTPAGTGAVTTTVQTKLRESVSVKDFGAVGNGVADDTAAVDAAITHGTANSVSVYFPKGTYVVRSNPGIELDAGSTVMYGDGATISKVKFVNDATYNTKPCFYSTNAVTRFEMRNMGIVGTFGDDEDWTERKNQVSLTNCDELFVENCYFYGSKSGALVVEQTTYTHVTGCHFEQHYRDACRSMLAVRVNISNNTFYRCLDDSIAISSYDPTSGSGYTVSQSNVINISDNVLEDSQGIICLGGKHVVIANNTITRPWHRAIWIGDGASFETGHTPILSAVITGNNIQDVFNGFTFDSNNPAAIYGIGVDGVALDSTDTVETYVASAVVTPYAHLYTKDVDEGSAVNAGNYNILISNNTVTRTLDATTNYSDYGFGERLTRLDWVDPAIAVTDIQPDGINLESSGNGLLITGNILDGCQRAIHIPPTVANLGVAFRNYKISNNILKNWANDGIKLTGDGLVEIAGNLFDGDPYHESTHRNAMTGKWDATYASHNGIVMGSSTDLYCIIRGNTFKNLGIPVNSPNGNAYWQASDNTQIGEPTATGYNAANIGLGFFHSGGLMEYLIVEDGVPTSAGFKTIKNLCSTTASSIPTTGTYLVGLLVKDVSAAANTGWKRLTTGTGHTIHVDWEPIGNDITSNITAYAGGGQANATQLTAKTNEVTVVATAGDSVKLPAAVAGLEVAIFNADVADACDVFPFSGDSLGSGINTAVSLAAGSAIRYVCFSATQWRNV